MMSMVVDSTDSVPGFVGSVVDSPGVELGSDDSSSVELDSVVDSPGAVLDSVGSVVDAVSNAANELK